MIIINLGQAELAQEMLENCIRKLQWLESEVGESSVKIQSFSDMEEVKRRLQKQKQELEEERELLKQMKQCLLQGIQLYTGCESGLAEYVEEVQAFTGATEETGVFHTPDWAFALL